MRSFASRLISLAFVALSAVAHCEMVPIESIHNDPEKEKLCKARSNDKPFLEHFLIDARCVTNMRALYPDATFIASRSGIITTCWLNQGTGKYQPNMWGGCPWSMIRPPEAGLGIRDKQDEKVVSDICLAAAREKLRRADYDHSEVWKTYEVTTFRPGVLPEPKVSGVRPAEYDIRVDGTVFYKASGPDLLGINFRCLLSPFRQLKALQTGVHDFRTFLNDRVEGSSP
jgi:hypothetical protein